MRKPFRTKQLPSGRGCIRDFTDRTICVGSIVVWPATWDGHTELRVGVVEDLDKSWIYPPTGKIAPRLRVRAMAASSEYVPVKRARWIEARLCVRLNCPWDEKEASDQSSGTNQASTRS